MPALLNNRSIRPARSTHLASTAGDRGRIGDVEPAPARRPAVRRCAPPRLRRCRCSTTSAPAGGQGADSAAPIPDPAPVTMACLPVNVTHVSPVVTTIRVTVWSVVGAAVRDFGHAAGPDPAAGVRRLRCALDAVVSGLRGRCWPAARRSLRLVTPRAGPTGCRCCRWAGTPPRAGEAIVAVKEHGRADLVAPLAGALHTGLGPAAGLGTARTHR